MSRADAFPPTRYQGSKAKLAEWIWQQVAHLDFDTCLDACGGTGAVAYRLKRAGKAVTYNDILRFNHQLGLALIENSHVRLGQAETDALLAPQDGLAYPRLVQDTFRDIYFTDAENAWIDRTITNIRQLADPYQRALAFFALCQACLIKRPYNLFHRKNLYLRLADVRRSFGNKTTWDTPFEVWFRAFVAQANAAVFDNGRPNRALRSDILLAGPDPDPRYDLVYIDPPYLSARGAGVDYREFYHFLEGLAAYDEWAEQIDYRSKHRRLRRAPSPWLDRRRIAAAFARLFERFRESILVLSYRSDGLPAEGELAALMRRYKRDVRVVHYGRYQYALSTNAASSELLIIGR